MGDELRRVCVKAGVELLAPHDLRHLAVTLMAEACVDSRCFSSAPGTRAREMSDHYTGWLARRCREAADEHVHRLDRSQ